MRPGISIILSSADRRRLEALVGDRNVAQKHVWRARIVLHCYSARRFDADRLANPLRFLDSRGSNFRAD